MWDATFNPFSYGFRPGRNAHQALIQSLAYINAGYQDIIDLDLKSFFDRVNHDILMGLLRRRINDPMLLRLIRRYLQSGMLLGGVVSLRSEGTPQGGPLSPLLSNILLNEFDRELTRRGHRFVRYADDCSIFLRSPSAARRVRASVERWLETKLRLQVNAEKTVICRPVKFTLLGYGFVPSYRKGERGVYRLRIAEKSWKRLWESVNWTGGYGIACGTVSGNNGNVRVVATGRSSSWESARVGRVATLGRAKAAGDCLAAW